MAKIAKPPTWVQEEQLRYQIGISLIPGVGDVTAKKLIAFCGGVDAVFSEKKHILEKIPTIGPKLAKAVHQQGVLARAEKEVAFVRQYGITPHWYLDDTYPHRLKQCDDGPVLLYTKGAINLNAPRTVSIVGMRNCTAYGRQFCEQLVGGLAELQVPVVSGLAYGIDICAHRAALKNGLPTVAVLAHGLDRMYPWHHRGTAEQMLENGGWVSEFLIGTNPDRENFPKRNRIVAGLSDAVIVIESKKRGGSLITAEIANSYSRDVFAVPGRIGDEESEGCNYLIRTNKAHLLESVENLRYIMGWNERAAQKPVQTSLFQNFSADEQTLVELLKALGSASTDVLAAHAKMSSSSVATTLLNLEFSGAVRTLPGKRYELCA